MKLPLLLSVSATLLAVAVIAANPTKGPKPQRVAQGQKIELTDYLVPGKTVIFDFTSEYCPPCRIYDEPLNQLHANREDIVVVKVDINRPDVTRIDWQSPVAQQYGLQSIPQFKVYGPDGKLLAADRIAQAADGTRIREIPARQLVDGWIGRPAK